MSLNVVAQLGTGISLIVFAFPALAVTQLPKKYPEAYKQSPFKVPYPLLVVIAITAIIILLYQSYLLISDLKVGYMIGTLIYILISAAIAQFSNSNSINFGITLGYLAIFSLLIKIVMRSCSSLASSDVFA